MFSKQRIDPRLTGGSIRRLAQRDIPAPLWLWRCSRHHEINITSSNPIPFSGVGTLAQGAAWSNVWAGGHNLPPGWHQYWPQFTTVDNNTNSENILFRLNPCPIGDVLGGGLPGCNIIDVSAIPSTSYIQTTWPSHSGVLALSGANAMSAGTLTLSNGTWGHGFTTPYSGSPPICTATDTTAQHTVQIFNPMLLKAVRRVAVEQIYPS